MTVDFHSPHPVNAAPANTASAGKSVDVQTLQEAFATALRNYGAERGGTFTNTMLEVLRAPNTSDAASDNQQQRREHQQQADRNDFTNIDRKLLDKSEIRSSEMNSAYRDRLDRNETFRNDYRERIEQSEPRQPTSPTPTTLASPTASSLDAARPNEPMPVRDHSPPQQNVPAIVNTNNQSPSVNAPNSTPNIGLASVLISGGNVPASMSTPIAPQVVPPQAFTIFTPSGRFGQTQKKMGDKENEEEESVEEQKPKKHQPFAIFEAIQAEATRSIQKNLSRQPKEPISQAELQRVAEKPRERPRKVEPDQSRSVKTLEEFLNAPAQNVSVQKKGEPNQPSQTQYLNRIAAACEAASYYAPIRIKINLDHLGTLTLRFFHKADKLMLRFETPSKESAQFLRDHLEGLRTILSKRKVKIADVEIHVDS